MKRNSKPSSATTVDAKPAHLRELARRAEEGVVAAKVKAREAKARLTQAKQEAKELRRAVRKAKKAWRKAVLAAKKAESGASTTKAKRPRKSTALRGSPSKKLGSAKGRKGPSLPKVTRPPSLSESSVG